MGKIKIDIMLAVSVLILVFLMGMAFECYLWENPIVIIIQQTMEIYSL